MGKIGGRERGRRFGATGVYDWGIVWGTGWREKGVGSLVMVRPHRLWNIDPGALCYPGVGVTYYNTSRRERFFFLGGYM